MFLKDIKFPDGYATNLARYISEYGLKVQEKLEIHSCHIPLQRIISAGLRGLVRKDIYEAVAELGNFLRELCCRNLRVDVVKRLKVEIPLIICKLERIFPPAFFEFMVNFAVHCRRKLVGSLPWGIPTVLVYRQTGAQATNLMVTQDTDKVFIQVRPPCGCNTYVVCLIVLLWIVLS